MPRDKLKVVGTSPDPVETGRYVLDEQVGFLMRIGELRIGERRRGQRRVRQCRSREQQREDDEPLHPPAFFNAASRSGTSSARTSPICCSTIRPCPSMT